MTSMNYAEKEFKFDRLTYSEKLSKSKQSRINLVTYHPLMLTDLLKSKSKDLAKALASYKFKHGLGDEIEVEFVEDDGVSVSRNLDGFVKEIKKIEVRMPYSIPAVYVTVRLC